MKALVLAAITFLSVLVAIAVVGFYLVIGAVEPAHRVIHDDEEEL